MTDADALLDAIFASPHDDTPRLVYADWLEETGHPEYARLVRLSCRLAHREVLAPAERHRLRRERYAAAQAVHDRYAEAFEGWNVTTGSFGERGIAGPWLAAPARVFVRNSPYWWPILLARNVNLLDTAGHERAVVASRYLERVEVLDCEGTGPGTDHDFDVFRSPDRFRPVSSELLSGLADGRAVPRLTVLTAGPVEATGSDLLAFATSPLAARLRGLRLVVRMDDGAHEELRTEGDDPVHVHEAIDDFLGEHRFRLPE